MHAVVDVLHRLCVKNWQEKERPQDWTKAIFVRLPKRRDYRECANHRMISPISHGSNVLLKVLLGHVGTVLDREIGYTQAGYRKQRGTTCSAGEGSSKNVGTSNMTLHL